MFNSLQRKSNFFPIVTEHPNLALKEYTPSGVIGAIRRTSLQDINEGQILVGLCLLSCVKVFLDFVNFCFVIKGHSGDSLAQSILKVRNRLDWLGIYDFLRSHSQLKYSHHLILQCIL